MSYETNDHAAATQEKVKRIGEYLFIQELGSGSFATVVKAISEKTNQKFAIKIFPRSNLSDHKEIEHLQHEIDVMYHLDHPNLVKLHDLLWDDKNYYLVEDYCEGGDLLDFILNQGSIPESIAAVIFKQIIIGMVHVHSFGVAHRDLKPENILIDKFPFIKITDFGLCGLIDGFSLMNTCCGSPIYCSPECIANATYDGKLSDIWSLGVLLYVLVTGETPWNNKNRTIMIRQISRACYSVPKRISYECKSLISSMLALKPDNRLSLQKILDHQWIKRADNTNHGLKIRNIIFPKMKKASLVQIIGVHRRNSVGAEIISPISLIEEKKERKKSDDEIQSITRGNFYEAKKFQKLLFGSDRVPLMKKKANLRLNIPQIASFKE